MKEILKALELHSENVNSKFKQLENRIESLESKMNEGFERVEQRLDRLEKKFDGMRVELTETQETVGRLFSCKKCST